MGVVDSGEHTAQIASIDEPRPCPNCASESAETMPRYAAELLVRCNRCHLVYAGQLPSSTELRDYYASYPESAELSELTARRFGELIERLEPFWQTGRLLDVGCGDGHFLVAAQQRGWTVYGSEFGEGPRRRAKQRGLDVRPAPFPPAVDELGTFDVVVAMEVIEHVTDPRDEVVPISTLLRRGGCLYLTTPNFNSLSRRIIGPRWRVIEYPEHLALFTSRTLDQLLATGGLSRLDMWTTGISPTDIWSGLTRAGERPSCTGGSADFDRRIRGGMARSPTFELAVQFVNSALSRSGLGDTIKALYQLR
jgi:2-polyprenyl-3-methyl-5-hydroxy-6-metoxy-1,4-benzoquinol methylase